MSRGAIRGAMAAWLGLVALETLTTGDSSSKVGGAFDWLASVFQRALDPKVPAIPDHSKTSAPAAAPAGAGAQDMTNPYLSAAQAAANPAGMARPGLPVPQ